jgi:hypothetical protein
VRDLFRRLVIKGPLQGCRILQGVLIRAQAWRCVGRLSARWTRVGHYPLALFALLQGMLALCLSRISPGHPEGLLSHLALSGSFLGWGWLPLLGCWAWHGATCRRLARQCRAGEIEAIEAHVRHQKVRLDIQREKDVLSGVTRRKDGTVFRKRL